MADAREELLALQEKAVVDFEPYAPGTEVFLDNSAPAPYPGTPGVGVIPDVMKFVVTGEPGFTGPIPMWSRAATAARAWAPSVRPGRWRRRLRRGSADS